MALKKGLGRGLDALLGEYAEAPAGGVSEADVNLIDTNAEQPRKTFDGERLAELAASISRHGVVQPIIVRRSGERYSIVAGERRYRAARMAGLATVPVIVREIADSDLREVALIENLQREDLNPIEEAAAIRFLMREHDLTQEEVSARLGKSRSAIANSLRLLNLPDGVKELVLSGDLSAGHARAIAAVKDEKAALDAAKKAVTLGLSVRETETLAARANEKPEKKERVAKTLSPDLFDAQERLRRRLGAKVTIDGSESRGRIVIEYRSGEALSELFDALIKE